MAEANYGCGVIKVKGSSDLSFNQEYGFKLGAVVYFTNSVGLELTSNYNREDNTYSKGNYFSVGLGFQVHLDKK